MTTIDDKIRNALNDEDQKAIDEIDNENGLFDMVAISFKGKQAWFTYYIWVVGFAAALLGLFFAQQYNAAADLKTSLSWALGIIACMFIIALAKIISWQQMSKLELMREIKRLEMRMMLLVEKESD